MNMGGTIMDYRDSFYLFGADAKQIPIIPRHGAPTEDTEGAIGLLCMDVSAPGAPMYKCVEVTEDNKYIWKPFLELTDQIKEMVPVIFNTTKVYDEEINGDAFPDTKFYKGLEYTVEVWQGEELLDSFTAAVKGMSFGSADAAYNPQIIGGLSLIIAMAGDDYVNFGFVGVGGEYHVKIYEKSRETNSDVISALSGFFVQQIDSTVKKPVQLHDLADGVYALRGEFANSVQLFNNLEYSFAILTHLGDMWGPIQLLHTVDFATVYKTVLSTYGDILEQELVSLDASALVEQAISANANLLTRTKDVASDLYSASGDSLLTKSQIDDLISDWLRTPKSQYLLEDGNGNMYSIRSEDGQLTAKPWYGQ
jgi:hypothetical protein